MQTVVNRREQQSGQNVLNSLFETFTDGLKTERQTAALLLYMTNCTSEEFEKKLNPGPETVFLYYFYLSAPQTSLIGFKLGCITHFLFQNNKNCLKKRFI